MNNIVIEKIKKNKIIYSSFYFYNALVKQSKLNLIKYFLNMKWYFTELLNFIKMNNLKSKAKILSLMPYIDDKADNHKVDYVYFLQDAWAASKIFEINPNKHIDIGSSLKTMSIISQYIPVTFVDIRGADIELEGLNCIESSILSLPFKKNCIENLSSICVIEHIGLGRYGDSIDPKGDVKAAKELQRVLKSSGNLLVTVPVDAESGVHFNAHRTYTRKSVLKLFNNCELIEEKYIYGKKYYKKYSKDKGFGTGLYHFIKK